jgi:2-isopropylmalate synthase
MLLNSVPGLDKCTISTHCHNDLGVAVANSLGGVSAGARQIECTINGIGERAGNASLEEVAMALQVRGDRLPYWTNIDSTKLLRASQMLQSITGFSVQPNKAIVGANAFAHESGIHQDGMLKNAQTYEIMTPESVGWTKTNLVLGKHSGRAAFRDKLVRLGYEDIGENAFQDAFVRFKDLADHKKEVTDEDIITLVDDSASDQAASFMLEDLKIHSIVHGVARVDVTVGVQGESRTMTTEGNGAVDAIFKGIKDATGQDDQKLDLYQVHAVTGGTDAQAKVTVRLSQDGRTVSGTGADYDTLFASARAYIHALNKLQVSERRVHAHRGGEEEGEGAAA